MHKEKHRLQVLEPDYWEDFVCSGGACPDTCCQGWDIVIDAATCARYEKSRLPEFRQLLARAVVHHQEEEADGTVADVACIRMGKGQRCLFLRNDGLCMIQRRTEEKNLSETCRTYPRVIHAWNGADADRSLCVSCPEAARLILLHRGHLRFVSREIDSAELDGLRLTADGERLAAQNHGLRQRLIRILQDDRLPVRRRLRLANRFFWQVGGLAGHHEERAFLAAAAAGEELREQAARQRTPLAAEKTGWLAAVEGLVRLRLHNPALPAPFRQRLEAALRRWQVDAAGRRHFREERELYDMFLLPRVNGLWENYLVNAVFKNVFLLEERADSCTAWFRIVLQFSLARFLLLAAFAGRPDDFGTADMVLLLQQLTRAVGHDAQYLEQAAAWVRHGEPAAPAMRSFCEQML